MKTDALCGLAIVKVLSTNNFVKLMIGLINILAACNNKLLNLNNLKENTYDMFNIYYTFIIRATTYNYLTTQFLKRKNIESISQRLEIVSFFKYLVSKVFFFC